MPMPFTLAMCLPENAKFSKICDEHDIKFIGASAEMIEKMGDKANAKATMAAGVPTIPGFSLLDSQQHNNWPKTWVTLYVKATAGGVEKECAPFGNLKPKKPGKVHAKKQPLK